MPNWCYNSIEVSGSPKNIGRIAAVIQTLKNSKDENDSTSNLFRSLIGLPPKTDMDKYENGEWYDTNVNWFGTKWDVSLDFVQEVTKDYILLSGETAWSPPINFCVELAKTYGVDVNMYYEEPGSDFCGKCVIDDEGGYSEEDYEYQHGIYVFEGFNEWYEREFSSALEWMVEEHQDDDEPDFISIIRESYGFLSEEEIEECAEELEKYHQESQQQV